MSKPMYKKKEFNSGSKSGGKVKPSFNKSSSFKSKGSDYKKGPNTKMAYSNKKKPERDYKKPENAFNKSKKDDKKRKREEKEEGDDENNEGEDNEEGGEENGEGEDDAEKVTRNQKEKQLKLARKKFTEGDDADLIFEIKKVWERARNKEDAERLKFIQQLFEMVQGHVVAICTKHDSSRVIQTLLKHGTEQMKRTVAKELKGHMTKLIDSKFSRFLVKKVFKYSSKEDRDDLIQELNGKIVSLFKNKISSDVIEYIYEEMDPPATALQKWHIISEFYGKEFALIKGNKPSTLTEILKERPEKKEMAMQSILRTITTVLDKGVPLVRYTLFHQLLCDVFENGTEKQISSFTTSLAPYIPEILHTKLGSIASCYCIAYNNAKNRRVTIKAMQGLVTRGAQEEYGQRVITALLRFTDDSVLVTKTIIGELSKSLEDLVCHQYGRYPILFCLDWMNNTGLFPVYLTDKLKIVQTTNAEGVKEPTTKKDDTTKHQEYLSAIKPAIVEYCSNNAKKVITDTYGRDIIEQAAIHTKDEQLFNAIIDLVADDQEFLETAHRTIKKLVKEADGFAKMLSQRLKNKGKIATSTRGVGFVILSLLEHESTKDEVKKELKSHQDQIKKSTLPACKHISGLL